MRKLATAAAVSLILASSHARALTLGEIEMRSALNQPMDAEIALASVASGELAGMTVRLASAEDFARAGIERSEVLTDLRFNVVTNAAGQPVIKVSSRQAVLEPFLNFLLEVDWSNGRVVREYTVLLDPPVFMTPRTSGNVASTAAPEIVDETSLLEPVAIERSDFQFDESSVALVGSANEVDDSFTVDSSLGVPVTFDGAADDSLGETVSLDGDIVSLEGDLVELNDVGIDSTGVELLPETFDFQSADEGEVVVLTDPNVEFNDTASAGTFDPATGWDVELIGGITEVPDDVGANTVASAVPAVTTSRQSASTTGDTVTVSRDDTLWEIADRTRSADLTTQQMMLALLDANEQAFINGNINLVREGAILRIPDTAAAQAITQAEAVAQVDTQEQLWREYRDSVRGTQSSGARQIAALTESVDLIDEEQSQDVGSATDNAAANSSAADDTTGLSAAARDILNQARNELNIVADQDTTTSGDVATSNDIDSASDDAQLGDISQQVQLAREELAAAQLESQEMSERGGEMTDIAESMEQLVDLRQNQLADLEAQLAQAREDALGAGANSVETSGIVDGDTAAEDSASADAAEEDGDLMLDEMTDEQLAAIEDADAGLEQVELLDVEEDAAVPAIEPGANDAEAGPWYSNLFSNPIKAIALGVGGLALLGLLATLLLRRRGRYDEDEFDYDDEEFDIDEDGFAASGAGEFDENFDNEIDTDFREPEQGDKSSRAGLAAGGGAAAAAMAATAAATAGRDDEADLTASADDTISEADVYLAYGLHGQAEELLTKAIDQSPDNADYQHKLLQTYHAQGEAASFDQAAAAYAQQFGTSDEHWNEISTMGQELNGSNSLYTGAAVTGAAAADLDSSFSAGEFDASAGFSGDADESALMDQSLDPGFAFDESDLEATGDFTSIAEEVKQELGDVGGDLSGNLGSVESPDFNVPSADTDGLTDKISGAGKAVTGGLGAAAAGIAGAVGLSGGKDDAASPDDAMGDSFGDTLSEPMFESSELGGLGDGISTDAVTEGLGLDADALGDRTLEFDSLDVDNTLDSATAAGASAAEELTLDLEQLTGDIDLENTELVGSGLDLTQELEIPDLTSDNSLLSDASSALGNNDEVDTMMDLAKAYVDMGDRDSAASALDEIIKTGNPAQRAEAEGLLRKIQG